MFKKILAVIVAFVCCSLSAKADLTGSTVQGGLSFNGGSLNYFNPMYGYVPTGVGNAGGDQVTIGSGAEFGFSDNINLDIADFTGTQLKITDACQRPSCTSNYSVLYTFNDAAFSGSTINFLSNGLGLTASLSGNVLTLAQRAGVPTNGTVTSVLNFTSPAATPEPSSLALLGTGILGVVAVARRRFAA